MNRLERIKGCLLGGAVGDALGAPVEFLEWSAIEAKFGPQGISLEHAVTQSLAKYGQVPGMEETRSLIERVLFFFYEGYARYWRFWWWLGRRTSACDWTVVRADSTIA